MSGMQRYSLIPISRALIMATTLCLSVAAQAQLTVSPQTNLQQLAASITGPGVSISNPTITCHSSGYGEFAYTGSGLGVEHGVILTSGTINNALGPNNVTNKTFQASTAGDGMLDIVTGRSTLDACTFEFDIIPAGDSLKFDFVFGSEEYNEWVGSQYNDVFGFFITGPGITGDAGIAPAHNIALVPGTTTAITINNINNGSNTAFHHDNPGGSETQYDGYTVGLSARSPVTPCQTYHLKLTVADATDRKLDSGVLINQVESNPVTMTSFTANGTPRMVEACNPGWVRFTRTTVTPSPLNLQYYLAGSATNGIDYTAIGNVNPLVPKSITIPANQAFVDRPVDPLEDLLPENSENILFILGNPFCPSAQSDTLSFDILDTLIATVSPLSSTICNGASVQFNIAGGMDFDWSPAAGLNATNIPNPIATPSVTTNYTVLVNEGVCSRTIHRLVRVSNLALSATRVDPLCDGAANGAINLSIAGGIAPYSYSWTGPGGFTANTQDISGVVAGTYSVTVTDAACTRTQSWNLLAPAPLSASLAPNVLAFGQNISCNGGSDGSIDATISGGTGPYTTTWSGSNGYTNSSTDINGLQAGGYTLNVTDAHGCTTVANATLLEAAALDATVSSISPVICFGDGQGAASVTITGGAPPYAYQWSSTPVQSSSSATNLPSGSTTITVTDAYGCTATDVAAIGGPVQALGTTITAQTNVLCFGNATGGATISASGGTAPYAFSWNTLPAQNTASATNLPAGTWICTVTDNHGCTTTRSATITQPATPLSASLFAQTNVLCHGNASGSATVSASGGNGPYTYQWNSTPAQNTATASNLSAGNYTCTVRDVNNCTAVVNVTITQPAAALGSSISLQTNVGCFGNNSGSATVNANGGTSPYAFTWNTSPVQSSATVSNLVAGSYTCSITDANGCTTTRNVIITQPAAALSTNLSAQNNVLCHGNATGSATIGVNGGTTPYGYSWNTTPVQTAATATNLPAGTWTCTVTDAKGCTATRVVTITQPAAALSASLSGQTNVSCVGNSTGSASVSVSGGTGAYSYQWNTVPVQNSAVAINLAAGTYSCTVTDANGCGTSVNATITQPAAPVLASITAQTDVLCFGNNTGAATIGASGGTVPYTYGWNTIPVQTAPIATSLGAGNYTCVVTDANGCTSSSPVTIAQPTAALSASSSITSALCQGIADGAIDATISGGTAPIGLAWSGPNSYSANTEDISTLLAGVYVLQITDANGCQDSSYHNVLEPSTYTINSALSAFIGGTNVSCASASDGSIDLTIAGATPPYIISWAGPGGYTAASEDISGLTAGTYVAIISDQNGCATAESFDLTAPQTLALALSATDEGNGFNISCNGGSNGAITTQHAGGTAPLIFTWTGPNGFTASTADITGLVAGNYLLTITDANGCAANGSITLTEPSALVASNAITNNVSCNGAADGAALASVSGGIAPYSFVWNSIPSQNGSSLAGVSAGTYTCMITDAHGCGTNTNATIAQPLSVLGASVSSQTNVACFGSSTGTATVTISGGTGPYTSIWGTSPTQSGVTANGLTAGTWTCSIADMNGCGTSVDATITQPAQGLSVSITSSQNVSCFGGSNGAASAVAAGGSGPYTYTWNSSPSQNGAAMNNVGTGTYTVTANDANGCSASAQVIIASPSNALAALLVSSTDQDCFGSATGQATVAASGGTAPYAFSWNTSPTQSGTTASGLAAGNYTVQVIDAHGCNASLSTSINGPSAPLSINPTSTVNVLCHGDDTGAASVIATGGTAPYNYSWNTNPTVAGPVLIGVPAGTWSANAIDANGCSASVNVTITQPAAAIAAYVEDQENVSCSGGADGWATLAITGGSGGYTVQWDAVPVQSGTTATNLQAGTYTASILDNNGCPAPTLFPVTITGPAAPIAISSVISSTNGYSIACHGGNDGWVDVTVTGGTAPYSYAWSDDLGNTAAIQDRLGLTAGDQHLTVTDAHGCSTSTTISLTEPPVLQASANITTAACQGSTDGAVDVSITGGHAPFTFLWTGPNNFGSNSEDILALPAGVYTLVTTDANGCSLQQPFDVNQPGLFSISATLSTYTGGNNVSCASSMDGSIDLSATGGTGPYSFAWTGPSGLTASSEDITGLGAGQYDLTLTDANGCGTLASYTLVEPAPLNTALQAQQFGSGQIACSGNSDGSIDATILGGTQNYTITWSGPNGFSSAAEDISGLTAGAYSMNVIDANGCTASVGTTLIEPAPLSNTLFLSQTATGDAIACDGDNTGSIKLVMTGGEAPYTVTWSGPNGFNSSNLVIAGLVAGTYDAMVTDANGCTTTVSVTLSAPPPIVLNSTLSSYIGGTAVSCENASDGSIDLTASGGAGNYQYQWTGTNAFTSSNEDINGSPAGSYDVQVIDQNGCVANASFTLDAPQPITATAAITTAACQGSANGAVDLTATGGTAPYGYFWSGPAAYSNTVEDISNLFAGVYSVTITDANGCAMTQPFDVNQPGLFNISAFVSTYPGGFNTSCAGIADGAIDATVTGGTGPYYYFWSGPNGFTSIQEDISDLATGSYDLTLTDQNGCSSLASYSIISASPVNIGLSLITYTGGANTSCSGTPDGGIDATIVGGVVPYSSQWTGPNGFTSITEDITALDAGNYILTVTDAVGCGTTANATINSPLPLDLAITTSVYGGGNGVSCASSTDGNIDLEISGGSMPYTITWSGPNGSASGDEDLAGLAAGMYVASITDANGCSISASVSLVAPSPIVIDLDPSLFSGGYNIPCNGGTQGDITSMVSGGNGAFTYSWTGPNGYSSSAATISGLVAGDYMLTVTDENGCVATASLSLSDPQPLSVSGTTSDAGNGYQVSCAGGDGSILLDLSGGTAPYQFNWTGPNGFASQNEDINTLTAGDYTIAVTDANGCSFNDAITLTAPAPLDAVLAVGNNICAGTSDGAIDLSLTGGTAPYTFLWSGPNGFTSTNEDVAALAGGDYTVSVNDAGTCAGTWTGTIAAAEPMDVSAYLSDYGAFNIPCSGDSTGVIELTVGGGHAPLSMTWSGPNGFNSINSQLSGLFAGDYTVTITDGNGCSLDSTFTLTAPASPIGVALSAALSPSGTNVSCNGGSDGSIDASVNGGTAPYTFDWRGPDSTMYSTEDISGLIAGSYELVISDTNQCTFTTSIALTEPDSAIIADIVLSQYTGGANTSCDNSADGSISATISGGSGGNSILWSGPNNFTANIDSIGGLIAGTYTLSVTDMNGCTLLQTIDVVAPEPITWGLNASTFSSGTNISCAGMADGAIATTINGGSGGYTAQWTGPNGFTASTADISDLLAGDYCVSIFDANGCTALDCITLSEPLPLDVSATTTAASCGQSNGSADATVNGGSAPYAYAWSNGPLTEDISGVAADTYTLTVTDANGCSDTVDALVAATASLTVNASVTDATCNGAANGSIDLEVTTGTGPFTFNWTGGMTTEDISGLPAGGYQVSITDAGGCSWGDVFVIGDPTPIAADTALSHFGNGHNVSGYGAMDGSILLDATGGTAPYTYQWSNGAGTAGNTGLAAGTYSVTITDANGCSLALDFVLTQPTVVELPTGFTPNGDGQNDAYVVHGLEAYVTNQFVVVNRWGNTVFDQLNYKNDWRGENQQGQQLPNGTYFVILRLNEGALTLQNYVDLRR